MPVLALQRAPPDCDAALVPLWPAGLRVVRFLHPGRDLGPHILRSASERLERAMTAQAKRFYYRSGCHSAGGKTDQLRNKVFLNGIQLFQLLVYRESDRRERLEETSSQASLGEQLFLVRFVKQLVQLTLPRNAFYVALAMGHFLCDYSGAETLMLYDSLFGHFRRTPDDSYRRARKSLLYTQLMERFGEQLTLVHGSRGESHFLEVPGSTRFRELIISCLNEFVPWGTPCLDLLSSDDSGNDHQNELRRMHLLLHPPCLQLHCRRLGIRSPLERLRLPRLRFFPKRLALVPTQSASIPPEN